MSPLGQRRDEAVGVAVGALLHNLLRTGRDAQHRLAGDSAAVQRHHERVGRSRRT